MFYLEVDGFNSFNNYKDIGNRLNCEAKDYDEIGVVIEYKLN